jgi:uncharacterized pyridoxal phosphate-containing UPF0001 family protein
MATIGDNLQQIRGRLAGAPGVTLLAVSKSQPVEAIRAAAAAGQKAFGENYVQEAIEKMDAVSGKMLSADGLEWHLIGPLQSRGSRHSVSTGCRPWRVKELHAACRSSGPPVVRRSTC